MAITKLKCPYSDTLSLKSTNDKPLPPIMSRLPLSDEEDHEQKDEDDYILASAKEKIPGSLPYCDAYDGLKYTQARLPVLDEFGKAAWVALHSLRPLEVKRSLNSTTQLSSRLGSTQECNFQQHDLFDRAISNNFNWSTLKLPSHLQGTLHGVVFRSQRAANEAATGLYEADRLAHEEAVNAGGLLMYWYGIPDEAGFNLATCVWTDKQSAKAASRLPKHREAVQYASKVYQSFTLSEYRLEKHVGETGLRVYRDARLKAPSHCAFNHSE